MAIRINDHGIISKKEKRYNIPTVAKAIGKTEGAISGFFSNKHISTREGITLKQIADVCRGRTRGATVKWGDVKEIRTLLLDEHGIEIVDEEEDDLQTQFDGV